jgi:NAD(P)H-flavin reductase
MNTTLIEWRELAPDVRHFVFEAEQPFRYVPGQFVSLSSPVQGKAVTRAYSVSELPRGNQFALCLNRVHDGLFSPFLFALAEGDSVSMKGPLGTFVWREPRKPSILVATGTGIAPIRAMLQHELAAGGDAPIHLIFGARYPHGLLYRDDFEAMAAQHPRFTFTPTVTRPDESWTGLVGRVQPLLLDAIGDSTEFEVYVCGLKEMVEDVRSKLKDRGFDRKQIIAEKYD